MAVAVLIIFQADAHCAFCTQSSLHSRTNCVYTLACTAQKASSYRKSALPTSRHIRTPADQPTIARFREAALDIAAPCLWPTSGTYCSGSLCSTEPYSLSPAWYPEDLPHHLQHCKCLYHHPAYNTILPEPFLEAPYPASGPQVAYNGTLYRRAIPIVPNLVPSKSPNDC